MQRSLCVPLSSARESSQQSRKLTLKRSTSLRTASECIQRTSKLTAGIPWRQRSNRLAAHQLRIGECIDFNYEFSTILAFVSNAELQSIVPANCPHKLTKSRRAAGPAAEPPRAARTARRHGGRTSLPPMLVQSRRPPRRSDAGAEGGFLQLRVSTLAGLREFFLNRERPKSHSRESYKRCNTIIASVTFPLAAPQGEERAATSKTRRRRSDTSGTRFVTLKPCPVKASARSVASPPARRTLVAARSSLAALPGAFGASCCLSRRSQIAQVALRQIGRA